MKQIYLIILMKAIVGFMAEKATGKGFANQDDLLEASSGQRITVLMVAKVMTKLLDDRDDELVRGSGGNNLRYDNGEANQFLLKSSCK